MKISSFKWFCAFVKIQFFKTFILPYFDYCISLFIYFNKQTLQKFCNKYYLCLFKLFKVEFSDFNSFDDINIYLHKRFGIYSFQHRIFSRISILSYKLLNFVSAPRILQDSIISNFANELNSNNASEDNWKILINGKKFENTTETVICKYKSSIFKTFLFIHS